MRSKNHSRIDNHIKYVRYLIDKGGPEKIDYRALDSWVLKVSEQAQDGRLLKKQVSQIQDEFGEAFSCETMQGFAFQKPHGYAGDYEIIDRIYQNYISSQPHLTKWDIYWQKNAAADAVRNRIKYLSLLLSTRLGSILNDKKLNVLNVASGPCRDLLYFFDSHSNANVHIDCVEQDEKAIVYATSLCWKYRDKINFIQKNAVRFKSDKKYDLIWSAGLFDYFEDNVFVHMLKKFKGMISSVGEVVIGNFSTNNPSKPFMEIFEWHLFHRSPETLKRLALSAGFKESQINIKKEMSGINLFLHLIA